MVFVSHPHQNGSHISQSNTGVRVTAAANLLLLLRPRDGGSVSKSRFNSPQFCCYKKKSNFLIAADTRGAAWVRHSED